MPDILLRLRNIAFNYFIQYNVVWCRYHDPILLMQKLRLSESITELLLEVTYQSVAILGLYCQITNSHKLSSLKQFQCIISQSCSLEVQMQVISSSGSLQAEIKVLGKGDSYLKLGDLFHAHLLLVWFLFSWLWLRSLSSCWLLTRDHT